METLDTGPLIPHNITECAFLEEIRRVYQIMASAWVGQGDQEKKRDVAAEGEAENV